MQDHEIIGLIANLRESATKKQKDIPEKSQPLSFHFYDGYLQALKEIREFVLIRQP